MNARQPKKSNKWKFLLSFILSIGIAANLVGSLYAMESSESQSQTQEETDTIGIVVPMSTSTYGSAIWWEENGETVQVPTYAEVGTFIYVDVYQGESAEGPWEQTQTVTYVNPASRLSSVLRWDTTDRISVDSDYWYYLEIPAFEGYEIRIDGTYDSNSYGANPFKGANYSIVINYVYVGTSSSDATLESIEVTQNPNQTEYTVGDTFNSTGLEVTAHYSDGTDKVLSSSDYTVSEPDMSTEGTKTITVTYIDDSMTVTATFEITVTSEDNQDNEGDEGGYQDGGQSGDGTDPDSGDEGGGNDPDADVTDPGTDKSGWTRLSGADRYATMVEVVKEVFAAGSSDYVVVASGQNFADSLAASSLAGVLDAPVILVAANELSTDAATQIERVGADCAYIVGGTSSVSDSVATQVANIVGTENIKRLSGDDRYETSVKVADETVFILEDQGQELQSVIIASGTVYADALSISPYAYTTASPIILAESNRLLGDTAQNWITSSGATSLIVAGGASSVADSAIDQTGISNSTRLSGENRYETSVAIANWAIENEYLSANGAVVVSGQNFPDALSSSALCGQLESVLLLVSSSSNTAVENFISSNASTVTYGYIVGGTSSVSEAVASSIATVSGIVLNN